MKTSSLLIFVSAVFLFSCTTQQQLAETAQKVTAKVERGDFVLKFDYAMPLRMQPVNLTSEYTLKLKGDSAVAFLPYYGVAHTAPMNSSEGGIKFSEPVKDFSIRKNKRNDGWLIDFKVNTTEYHYQLHLVVYTNGKADLQVVSAERDAISFTGEMEQ